MKIARERYVIVDGSESFSGVTVWGDYCGLTRFINVLRVGNWC